MTVCGRVRGFAECLGRDLEHAKALEKRLGGKLCVKCVSGWNVAQAIRKGDVS
jgi:hypothetical protein